MFLITALVVHLTLLKSINCAKHIVKSIAESLNKSHSNSKQHIDLVDLYIILYTINVAFKTTIIKKMYQDTINIRLYIKIVLCQNKLVFHVNDLFQLCAIVL